MVFIHFIAFVVLRSTPGIQCASSSSDPPRYDQIDHVQFLTRDISNHYLNERLSDVVLLVDNEELYAHRFVLALHSEYFRSLLYGEHNDLREVNVPIKVPIKKVSATVFKAFLKYIYTGQMDLSTIKDQDIVEILRFSDSFGFPNLQFPLTDYLRRNMCIHNIFWLLALASHYQLKPLEDESLNFIDIHAFDVLQTNDSLSLSFELFQKLINRDTACVNELDIFRAACRWIKKNQDGLGTDAKTQILSAVRYQLMLDEELSEVRRSELVRLDAIILDVIKSRTKSLPHELDFRGQLESDVNFVERPSRSSYIRGSTMIKLDSPSCINYIEIIAFHAYLKTYSYYIEVSMDGGHWLRVIDYSNHNCQSVQRLWIHRRFVWYIRIVSTKNNIEKFKFLTIMYNTDMHLMEIKNGLVAPKYNVALTYMGASVIQGNSIPKRFFDYILLNGDYKKYDKNNGFTYHSLKSEAIKVQLNQPYVLGSMRLLLWDYDSRTYGYTIEVSVDNQEWDIIVDKSNESCRSWQLLEFDPRPMVYIRITGVHTSKNDGRFMCVHLEAPAQERTDTNIEPTQQRSILRLFKPTHIRN